MDAWWQALPDATNSQLTAVMVGGFATVAGRAMLRTHNTHTGPHRCPCRHAAGTSWGARGQAGLSPSPEPLASPSRAPLLTRYAPLDARSSVLPAYMSFGAPPVHLVAAAWMGAPASFTISKLLVPASFASPGQLSRQSCVLLHPV